MSKIIFTLGSPAIGGGTIVIFEHATRMKKAGEDVYIVTDRKISEEEYSWHPLAHTLKWVTYDEIKKMKFDMAIATWWRTVYDLYKINANKYVYFVQSIESKFYSEQEKGLKILSELTYMLGMKVITEATWIKNYLEKYGIDAYLVHNGIRKDIFKSDGEKYDKCNGLRVLVEGPVDVAFKNVPKTIELVRKSNAKEIWLLTSSSISSYEGVDRVFSKVPPTECSKIYRSCDVIVKLSYVEGMFGPPLEMFHCGGTAIVYDVTGHDEYIVHNKNGLVVKTDDEEKVVEYINKLSNEKTLARLKKGALDTASKWISWEQSSKKFYEKVKELLKMESVGREEIENKSKFFFDIYVEYENKNISMKTKIGEFLRNKMPRLYKIYRKMIGR